MTISAKHRSLARVSFIVASVIAFPCGQANAGADRCGALLGATDGYETDIVNVYKYRNLETKHGEQYQLILKYPAECRVVPMFTTSGDQSLTALFALNFGNYRKKEKNICESNMDLVENGNAKENVQILFNGHAWSPLKSRIIPFGPYSKASNNGNMIKYALTDDVKYNMKEIAYSDVKGWVDNDFLDSDYLYSNSSNGVFSERFVRCSKEGTYPVPQCQHWLKYGRATLKLGYARVFLSSWPSIENMVDEFFGCIVASDGNDMEGE